MRSESAQPSTGLSPAAAAPPIIILNQFYVPDVASTGHLLHELATGLARTGFDVSVISSRPSYGPPESWLPAASREVRDGVDVRRMRTTRLPKDNLAGRLMNSATFLVPLTLRILLSSSKGSIHLYTTNPPFLGVVGAMVSLFRRHRYLLLLHDAYPQMAVWVGTIRARGRVDRIWHAMNRLTYRRAEQTIVLCEAAKTLVCDTYGIDPARVHVIHNWADGDELRPKPKSESQFAKAQGLIEPFTLLYSGNLGLYYEFETLLDAAEMLRGENFRLVLIGSGGRRKWLEEQIAKRKLSNTRLLPYQPFDKLPDSLTACDASLVTIAKGVEGISFPSKLYSALAVGRPIVALSEEHSELRALVQEHDVGRWFRVGDAAGIAAGVREMMQEPQRLAEQGRKARQLFENRFTLDAAVAEYARVFTMPAPSRNRAATEPRP